MTPFRASGRTLWSATLTSFLEETERSALRLGCQIVRYGCPKPMVFGWVERFVILWILVSTDVFLRAVVKLLCNPP